MYSIHTPIVVSKRKSKFSACFRGYVAGTAAEAEVRSILKPEFQWFTAKEGMEKTGAIRSGTVSKPEIRATTDSTDYAN
jgi:hypothetical protein